MCILSIENPDFPVRYFWNYNFLQSTESQNEPECISLNLNQKLTEDLRNAEMCDFSPDENDATFLPYDNSASKLNLEHCKRVQEFMLILALCNTVVISTHSHKNEVSLE